MFGDSKNILQCNEKKLTVRNARIDMNFVKKTCRKSNVELRIPRLCLCGNFPSFNGFVNGLYFCLSAQQSFISKFVSSKKKTVVIWLDFNASFRFRPIIDIVLVWGNQDLLEFS